MFMAIEKDRETTKAHGVKLALKDLPRPSHGNISQGGADGDYDLALWGVTMLPCLLPRKDFES